MTDIDRTVRAPAVRAPAVRAPADRAHAVGLVLNALGILFLLLTGATGPGVPIGVIVLVVLAIATLTLRWHSTPVLGIVFSLFIAVSGFGVAPGWVYRFTHPAEISGFVGSAIQVVGIVLAVVAGVAAVRGHDRSKG